MDANNWLDKSGSCLAKIASDSLMPFPDISVSFKKIFKSDFGFLCRVIT